MKGWDLVGEEGVYLSVFQRRGERVNDGSRRQSVMIVAPEAKRDPVPCDETE